LARECGGSDCDDANPSRAPGFPEVCDLDNVDEDCDPRTFGFRDGDGDGAADARCCNADPEGERPDADSLRATLDDVAADSFDCGMRVLRVEVSEDAPYRVDVTVTLESQHLGVVERGFQLEATDAAFDLVAACIDEMGALSNA